MDRNVAADEFVNCVVRRGDRDLYLKPSLAIAALFVPIIFGFIVSTYLSYTNNVNFSDNIILVGTYTALVTELALLSFMIFCVSRSNIGHRDRDKIWMESLCDYVDSHGGNSTKMRTISKRNRHRIGGAVKTFSMFTWLLIVAVLIATGFEAHFVNNVDGFLNLCLMSLAPIIILICIQFIATIGAVFTFPSFHDNLQTEFTEELSRQCATFGLQIPAMRHAVKRRNILLRILLTIVTLGLFLIIYLVIACNEMNKHLLSQWEYEEMVMDRIIEFEGGSGIEATSEDEQGTIAKILNGLI